MRRFSTLILVLFVAATSANAKTAKQSHPLKGWNLGFSIHMFEPNGNGSFDFPQGDYDFNLKRLDSRPLVDDYYYPYSAYVGLGWENKQILGLSLNTGYSWGRRLNAEVKLTGYLPKNQDLYYATPSPPDSGYYSYIHKQQTDWYQWGVRAQIDYAPFKALPLWYFSLGGEYTWFKTKLRYDIYKISSASNTLSRKESYLEAHDAVGVLFGTGISMREYGSSRLTTIGITYSLTKYNGTYFERNGDLFVGGLTLEIGFRIMGDQAVKNVAGIFRKG